MPFFLRYPHLLYEDVPTTFKVMTLILVGTSLRSFAPPYKKDDDNDKRVDIGFIIQLWAFAHPERLVHLEYPLHLELLQYAACLPHAHQEQH